MFENVQGQAFDFPERYETEAETRVIPDDRIVGESQVLRVKMPPGRGPFAVELFVRIVAVQNHGDFSVVTCTSDDTSVVITGIWFNRDGMMVDSGPGSSTPAEPEPVGYFVGSTDPWDLAAATLVGKKQPALAGV